jgi:hypothetical protein
MPSPILVKVLGKALYRLAPGQREARAPAQPLFAPGLTRTTAPTDGATSPAYKGLRPPRGGLIRWLGINEGQRMGLFGPYFVLPLQKRYSRARRPQNNFLQRSQLLSSIIELSLYLH